jgi:hypothetical protein
MVFCAPLDSRTPYSQTKSQLMHDGQPRLERCSKVGSNQSGVQLSVSAPLDPGWPPTGGRPLRDRRISCLGLRKMLRKPAACMLDHRLEGARFFEEVRGAGHDDELLFAAQLGQRGAVKGQHLDIVAADDQ